MRRILSLSGALALLACMVLIPISGASASVRHKLYPCVDSKPPVTTRPKTVALSPETAEGVTYKVTERSWEERFSAKFYWSGRHCALRKPYTEVARSLSYQVVEKVSEASCAAKTIMWETIIVNETVSREGSHSVAGHDTFDKEWSTETPPCEPPSTGLPIAVYVPPPEMSTPEVISDPPPMGPPGGCKAPITQPVAKAAGGAGPIPTPCYESTGQG